MIKCKICNQEFKNMITWKHLKKHNITTTVYKEKHGDVVSAEYRELKSIQNSGANNPNYNNKWDDDQKKKASNKMKGNIPWNKDIPMEAEQKEILREKALQRNKSWREEGTHPIIGQKRNKITRKKIKEKRDTQVITREQCLKAIETKKKKGYDIAFFRNHTHKPESIQKMLKTSEETRRITRFQSMSKLIEFAITEGFLINAIIDADHWNVTCPMCNNSYDITKQYFQPSKYRGKRCINCDNNYNYISKDEQLIFDYISSITGYPIIQSDRSVLNGKELDIYIPDLNLAIEYCGLYWHSDTFKHKSYHLDKTIACDNRDIKLLTIFEDEWRSNQLLVKSMIKNHIHGSSRIFARKCGIAEITSKEANLFLKQNHIQGSGRSNYRCGLFFEDKLVAVMTFSKSNISRKINEWEINRFCSILNTNIVGGASRLFKYFVNFHHPNIVISYADRRWSTGNVYYKLGFELDSITPVNYWYWKPNDFTRYHRYTLRKNKDDDQSLTEFKNRDLQGWNRIYDCGNYKFIWRSEED